MSQSVDSDLALKISSFDSKALDRCVEGIINRAVKKHGVQFSGPIFLPRDIKKVTVNRSPHVDRKAQEQFEVRRHKRMIIIRKVSQQFIETLQALHIESSVGIEFEFVKGK